MNADAFAHTKRGALLINTARGALVDEPALTATLREEDLSGANLDTLSSELPRLDNPLLKAPNVILTSRVAGQTSGSIERKPPGG